MDSEGNWDCNFEIFPGLRGKATYQRLEKWNNDLEIGRVTYLMKPDRTVREAYGASYKRLKRAQIVQNKSVEMKMQILDKVKAKEEDVSRVQEIIDQWVFLQLRDTVQCKLNRCMSVMIFGLEEELPKKEEGECLKKLLDAVDLPNAIIDIKEARRIGRYRKGIKGRPLRITFYVMCSQKVLN